ncbi:MAG: HNH endonuclease signature motif containing protein [Candidatus Nanopelagicales bacterium]
MAVRDGVHRRRRRPGTRATASEFDVECQIVSAVLPSLDRLSVAAVKLVVAHALDLLHPDDRDAAEQADYDRRSLSWTHHGGMTMITADLPGIDGTAVTAALTALAESLRRDGDGLTLAQRRADALITLVNAAAAHDDLPATASGLPVAATITIGVAEADRVASAAPRPTSTDLATQVRDGADPATIAGTPGRDTTLGDAATRFALCTGTWTGALIDDRARRELPISQALAATRTQPLAVGRATRLATPAQRIALALRDRGCLLCNRPAGECQTHHVTPWAQGGTTDLDQMVLLCWAHHRQVDLGRWEIVRNTDPTPGATLWKITPTPRTRWRTTRQAA